MNEALTRLVPIGNMYNITIDKGELFSYTEKKEFDYLNRISWEGLRYLHILGSKTVKSITDDTIEPGCYVNETENWLMVYGCEQEWVVGKVLECTDNLKVLNIRSMGVRNLDVSHLSGLIQLDLADNKIEGLDLSNLTRLQMLSLSKNYELTQIEGINKLINLRELLLVRTSIAGELNINGYEYLEILNVSGTKIHQIVVDFDLPHMSLFWAYDTIIENFDFLGHFPGLKKLSLSKTPLRRIPECIRHLKKLGWLRLTDLELEELPDWFPDLKLSFHTTMRPNGISLRNTKVKGVDMSIFSQPQEMILQWFEERKKGNEVPLNEIKVVFLGNGEVGKSHTIARLLNNGEEPGASFSGSATPGIAIESKEYDIDGQKVQVHFWDFGGQDILYSMHRMFLTKRTIYVILVDARNETKSTQARDWLDTVKSFAEDAPVLLVVNKIDQNPNASIDEQGLKSKYSNLKSVIYMSALKDGREKFNANFATAMLDVIRLSGVLEIKWPRKWTQVKAELQNMKTSYIFNDAYTELCQNCGVTENRENLLEWFNDLGVSFCHCRDYKLKDYVILRPDWITNAIYTILFNKRNEIDNGMISLNEISRLLTTAPEEQSDILRVRPEEQYKWGEIRYILDVVNEFRLSYSVSQEMEFFPMLCKENSKPVAQEYADDPNTLEFRMEFEYLPNNVLHRLMVENWKDLDTDNIWLTGVRFIQRSTGLSAVVRIDKNLLLIYVRCENKLHSPNTYLSIIKDSVDYIWKDLSLQEPKMWLIYKVDGKSGKFEYKRLLQMYARGNSTDYSYELNDDFLISDILNQLAPADTKERNRLLKDIVQISQQLQANEHFWGTEEDVRNTEVRDKLRIMDYVVHDQTFQGISGTGKKAGELDFDIRRYENIPWTICEALRINSCAKTDWDNHLKKLLDNYNPHGASFLFLLTYVDCEKSRFGRIWENFEKHIQQYSTESFECSPQSYEYLSGEEWSTNEFIKTACCKYRCGEYAPLVYHIFVRMGR